MRCDMEKKTMTVKEIISDLQKCDPDKPVKFAKARTELFDVHMVQETEESVFLTNKQWFRDLRDIFLAAIAESQSNENH